MSETLAPIKSTTTTPPCETFVEVSHTLTEGVLLYRPDDNSFIALYSDEWLTCRADAHANKTAIEALQDANRVVTEKSKALQHLLEQPNSPKSSIIQARKDLDSALDLLSKRSDEAKQRVEAITSQKTDSKKLVELLPLTLKRLEGRTHTPIYISADKLRGALADRRVYVVEGEAERKKRPQEKLFSGMKLNQGEVRKRILDQVHDVAKFEKKWKLAPNDADAFSGILTDWAKVMGADATSFLERGQKEILEGVFGKENTNPDNPYRMVDLKPEAQFMRWSAGAGCEANFLPFQGNLYDNRDRNLQQRLKRVAKTAQFNIKANAQASFAVGEGKVETMLYLPHSAGWHVIIEDPQLPLDCGFFRLRGDLTLYAMAGASVAIEAGASLMVTGDKQGVRGTPPNQAGAKAKVGGKGEAKIFAGLKEGVSLVGALQWLNPEGLVDPKTPKKVDPTKVIAAYTDIASVSADASLIQGLAATLGFECGYRDGNFVIAAKAGACLGLGGSGNIGAKVKAEEIRQFFMCIAHQLKQADYKKLCSLMSTLTFMIFNQILFLSVVTDRALESFVGILSNDINKNYQEIISSISSNKINFIKQIENKLRSGWGWHAYMPPESRGAIIASIINAVNENKNNTELRKNAAFSVNELMATTQSIRNFENTLDRITVEMGDKPGRDQGIRLINSVVADTIFEECINKCEIQVANAEPIMGRPFMRNDEPDFMLAQFPLHHPAYLA